MSNRKLLLNLLISGLALLVIGGTITIVDDLRTSSFPVIDVRAFGAVNDAVQVNVCNITAPSHTLTCSDPYGLGLPRHRWARPFRFLWLEPRMVTVLRW